jgi:hypothetical protein
MRSAGTALLFLFLVNGVRAQGCDQTLWQHVYHPQRLAVIQACAAVTGTIVDASHGRNKDGARHEADGDTHGWLQIDPGQENIVNAGNAATQGGNLVFEIVCRYRVTQADAKASCKNFKSTVTLPPVGSHVRIIGPLVEDLDHKPIHREIHPVTSIELIQDTATSAVFRASARRRQAPLVTARQAPLVNR